MDTFLATKKGGVSSRGNTCCQLFVSDKTFLFAVPMKARREVLQAIKLFAKEVGPLNFIICDPIKEQKSTKLKAFLNEIGCSLRLLEEGRPWANKAELFIGILKDSVRQDIEESGSPLPFWDYCVERRVQISNLTAKRRSNLQNSNAHTLLTTEEGDICNLCQFNWYEWCYYRERSNAFPFHHQVLG